MQLLHLLPLISLASAACFPATLTLPTPYDDIFNSAGLCASQCHLTPTASGEIVTAAQGISCYCLSAAPEAADAVDDKFCDLPCPGYENESCGSESGKYISVSSKALSAAPKPKESASTTTTAKESSTPTSSATKDSEPKETALASTNSTTAVTTPTASNATDSKNGTAKPEESEAPEDSAAGRVGMSVGLAAVVVAAGFAML